MVTIEINNTNQYNLTGNIKTLNRLYKAFKIKHPNAFFLRTRGNVRNWDGMVDFITERFTFRPGLLNSVCNWLEENQEDFRIKNNLNDFGWPKPKIPKLVGNKEPRDYQIEAVKSLINNKVKDHNHYIGVIDAATNAGKTLMMAMVYLSFKSEVPAIMLLKDGDLFEQFKEELPELIPKEDLGFVRGKNIHFNKFTVAMVQTLSPKAKMYTNHLSKFGIVLVDEADEGNSKTYQNIIKHLWNCRVRVGLSGTIYMSKLAKDKLNNMNLRSFFGDVIFKITKKEMVEKGHSTKVVIKLHDGSDLPPVPKDFYLEYVNNITNNRKRIIKGLRLLKFNIKFNRLPALIIYRYHQHGENIYRVFQYYLGKKYKIALVHGGIKDRKFILKKFREGHIDILISSFIVKRGKNFPRIKYIQNQSATDSNETISQIMGRGERTHESKKKYYLDDFMDQGIYLSRHSKHRKIYYTKEGFKVINKCKTNTIKNKKS